MVRISCAFHVTSPHRVSKLHVTLPEFEDAVYKKSFRLNELF